MEATEPWRATVLAKGQKALMEFGKSEGFGEIGCDVRLLEI
jgi:hypothetical protein